MVVSQKVHWRVTGGVRAWGLLQVRGMVENEKWRDNLMFIHMCEHDKHSALPWVASWRSYAPASRMTHDQTQEAARLAKTPRRPFCCGTVQSVLRRLIAAGNVNFGATPSN